MVNSPIIDEFAEKNMFVFMKHGEVSGCKLRQNSTSSVRDWIKFGQVITD